MIESSARAAPFATRFRVACRAAGNVRLPNYAGSTLRGPFGEALRHLSCVTGIDTCTRCPLYRQCPYPEIFETPPLQSDNARDAREPPRPYVIEPPAIGARQLRPGNEFEFFVVLFGRAQRHAKLVRKALTQAARDGKEIGRFSLVQFSFHDAASISSESTVGERVRIEFLTPTRLIKQGRILDATSLDFPSFAQVLMHRLRRLDALHGAYPMQIDIDAILSAARRVRDSDRTLEWIGAARWSNRQHRQIPLGGVVGTWALTGDFRVLWPLLHAGQWTHVGKETTFGLGQYRVLIPPQI